MSELTHEQSASQLANLLKPDQQLLLATSSAIIVLDAQAHIQQADEAVVSLTGIARDRLLSHPLTHYLSEHDTVDLLAALQRLTDGVSRDERLSLAVADAGDTPRLLSVVLVAMPQAGLFQGMLRDLSGATDPDVAASERRYRELFDSTFDAIAVHRNDILLDVNPAFERLFGYTREEAVGLEQMPYIVPEEQHRVRMHLQLYSNKPRETLGKHRDGTIFPIEIQGKIIVYQGEQVFYLTARDITARKAAEEQLRLRNRAIEHSTSAIAIADAREDDLPLIYVNPSFEQITGYDRDEIIGRNCRFLQGDDRDQPEVAIMHEKLAKGEECSVTLRNYKKDGTLFWNDLHISPVYDNDGNLTHFVSVTKDITAARQHEEELRRRTELYRILARNLPDSAVLLFDTAMRYLIAEGPVLERMGFGSNIEGQSLKDILPNASEDLVGLYEQVLAGEEVRLELTLDDIIFDLHGVPIRGDDGDIRAGMLLAQDITARRKAEVALRQSEQRNRALLNTMPDMMFVLNREGFYTETHVASRDTSVLALPDSVDEPDPQQLVGMSLHDTTLPAPVVDETLMYIDLAMDTGEIQSFEYSLDDLDDQPRYFEARMVALNEDEVLVVVRDITDLKRIQDELSKHIEDLTLLRQVDGEISERLNMTYVVELALDAAMRLCHADAGFIALYENESFVLSHAVGLYDTGAVEARLRDNDSMLATIVADRQPQFIEDVTTLPDYTPLLDDTSAMIVVPLVSRERMVAVMRLEARADDRFTYERFQFLQLMTGRIAPMIDNARLYRQTQQQLDELQRLYEEVSKLEQLKTDMIRIASHDLRGPLAGVMGYVEMLKWDAERLMDESQLTSLRKIEQGARDMQRITTGILSLERIEQMAQNSTSEVFNFTRLVRRIYSDHQSAALKKYQKLQLELATSTAYVNGDTIQLAEAVTNLIGNAIKYTPEEGDILVNVSVTDDDYMEFRVIDTGYGIPEAQQKRLFSPFFRAKMQETKAIEGTGLGLHLVKNIIERHNGEMIFQSKRGEGSTFGFRLRVSDAPPPSRPVDGSTVVG